MSNEFDDLLSLDYNSGALTVTKVIASELERGGTITIDANGAGADIRLSAIHVIIEPESRGGRRLCFLARKQRCRQLPVREVRTNYN